MVFLWFDENGADITEPRAETPELGLTNSEEARHGDRSRLLRKHNGKSTGT